jgi:hypothetical protein
MCRLRGTACCTQLQEKEGRKLAASYVYSNATRPVILETTPGMMCMRKERGMTTKTRMKLLIVGVAAVMAFAVLGAHNSQAATGGTIVQFSTDPTITSTSSGVTSSQAFPDGSTTALCFIQVTTAGAQPAANAYGACTGITVTQTCGSVSFDKTGSTGSSGAALTINGTKTWKGFYDTGPSCTTVTGQQATSSFGVAGLTAGQNVIAFWNNDTQGSRDGCVAYTDSGATAASQCFANSASGKNGTFYEATAQAATGIAYQTKGSATPGSSGNLTLGGVFIEAAQAAGTPTTPSASPTPTTPSASPTPTKTIVLAAHASLSVSRSHGVTTLRWYSTAQVRGFNVFDGTKKVNRKLVTSHNFRYTFKTTRVLHHPWVSPVQ